MACSTCGKKSPFHQNVQSQSQQVVVTRPNLNPNRQEAVRGIIKATPIPAPPPPTPEEPKS